MQRPDEARGGGGRQVHEHEAIPQQELVEQRENCVFVQRNVPAHWLEAGEQVEAVAGMQRAALEKQLVDALGPLQRLVQRVGRAGRELQRGVAALQVQVDQHHPALALVGETHRRVHRNRGRADAPAHARARRQAFPPRAFAGRSSLTPFRIRLQTRLSKSLHQRLEKIFGDPGGLQLR